MKLSFSRRTFLIAGSAAVIAVVSLAIWGLSNRGEKKTKLP
ncbi:multidrug transporter, partial [Leptospira ellisii]